MSVNEPIEPIAGCIPPSDAVRKRLAVILTEAGLLRSLLRLAVRREREAERLARVCRPGAGGGPGHAA
jgi:hypothetical protein